LAQCRFSSVSTIPRKLDEEKQKAFIDSYNKLLDSLTDNEAVVRSSKPTFHQNYTPTGPGEMPNRRWSRWRNCCFVATRHPTHAARPAGCWAPSQENAIDQTSGRQRINIHGAIDLETGQTQMIEALTKPMHKSANICITSTE